MNRRNYTGSGGPSATFRQGEAAARIEAHDGHYAFGWSGELTAQAALQAGFTHFGETVSNSWAAYVKGQSLILGQEAAELRAGRPEPFFQYLGKHAARLYHARIFNGETAIAWSVHTPDSVALPGLYVAGAKYYPQQTAALFENTAAEQLNTPVGRVEIMQAADVLLRPYAA